MNDAQRARLRSKRFKKKRMSRVARVPMLKKVNYGKEMSTRVTTAGTLTSTVVQALDVYNLDLVMSQAADFGGLVGNWTFYNINKVKIQFFPTNISDMTPNAAGGKIMKIGFCYEPTVVAAVDAWATLVSCQRYTVTNMSSTSSPVLFSFTPQSKTQPPFSTADTNNNKYGYIKFYSDSFLGTATVPGFIIFKFYVTFGSIH